MTLLIVAIGGPSSSGKTTVARALRQVISEAPLVHLDDFYLPDSKIPQHPTKDVANWDCPEAIDWEKFKKYIEELRSNDAADLPVKSLEMDTELKLVREEIDEFDDWAEEIYRRYRGKKIVLVEGFMLFHDKEISDLFDKKLLFHGPYEVLKERRESRPGYHTAEGFWKDPPNYFDDIVWPEFKRTHEHLFKNGDVEGKLTEEAEKQGIRNFNNTGIHNVVEMTEWALKKIAEL
ncbi:hypothetical protein FDK38_004285 [Candidozyma auris]|nr:hypothetical protein FDK38_004285 [[Candida] auris]